MRRSRKDLVSRVTASRFWSIPRACPYLDGTELDFVREGLNEGFQFNNPNVKDAVRLRRKLQRLIAARPDREPDR